MLAKATYNPLGVSATQTPTASYYTGSSQKTTAVGDTQKGMMFVSPTESSFSDVYDGLDAVR